MIIQINPEVCFVSCHPNDHCLNPSHFLRKISNSVLLFLLDLSHLPFFYIMYSFFDQFLSTQYIQGLEENNSSHASYYFCISLDMFEFNRLVKKFLGGEWLELFEEQRYSVKFSNF
jgi:hypothetical protein